MKGDDCDEDDNQDLDDDYENEEVDDYVYENRRSQIDEKKQIWSFIFITSKKSKA